MTTTISIIYLITMFICTIIFFVAWYRTRKQVSVYKKYGFVIAALYLGFELLIVILWISSGFKPSFIFIGSNWAVTFFRITAFTIMGIHYCSLLRIPSLPIILQQYGFTQELPTLENTHTNANEEDEDLSDPELLEAERASNPKANNTPKVVLLNTNYLTYWSTIFIVVAGGIIFSSVLFFVTKPTISTMMKQFSSAFASDKVLPNDITLTAVISVLAIAFMEEITFRLGIQNLLATVFNWREAKYWYAIILTTIFWTIGHTGVMEPNWIKLVQVFPFGLALGWLFKKYGSESTIIAHMLFNVGMLVPAKYLITF